MSAIRALARKSARQALSWERLFRGQSWFKVVFVLAFAAGLEAGLWLLFLDGLKFLDHLGGVGVLIIGRLFSLFFLGMAAMIAASSVVSSYSTIFRSEEIPFLLVRPFRIPEIVGYKFLESTLFASWAFFFVIIPFLGAYAWHDRMSLLFGLWTLLFSVPFLVLCSAAGTVLTLLLIRYLPRGRLLRVAGAVLGAAAVAGVWWLSRWRYVPGEDAQFNLSRLIPGMRLASYPLLPNWWMSEGILSLSRGQWLRGAMLWCVLLSSALMGYLVVEGVGRLTFYDGWLRGTAGREGRRRAPVLMPWLDRLLSGLARDIRCLVLKDVRIFLRDPMQWSQVLVFFGLLGLYFANLRSFRYHAFPEAWRNTIAFINVFSVSSVVCSVGSRFVYPQLSLEGQGFWILGLSPLTARKILLTKFGLAVAGLVSVSIGLMALSGRMLGVSVSTQLTAIFLAAAVSMAICGLSTGLGAVFLDLRQRNPAAIVSGFGGTLNLVLSLAFMLATIVPFGFAFHLHSLHKITAAELHRFALWLGVWCIVLTAATTTIPLALGARSLRNREF
jgi:ABC-2 type transport system permease protein